MFPYPSGDGLHVGHPEGYTATDIVCRYRRMRGYSVMHPDGLGRLRPARRAACQADRHPLRGRPRSRTSANFRRQLKMLGFSYDWDRELATTDVDYFRWTQFIFLVLFDTWFDPERQQGRPIAELPIPDGGRRGRPGGRRAVSGRAAAGLSARGPGQLVPGPGHRAGQRGGARRRERARRASGGPHSPAAMDAADHRLRRPAGKRPRRAGLAREHQALAAELDRPEHRGGGRFLHRHLPGTATAGRRRGSTRLAAGPPRGRLPGKARTKACCGSTPPGPTRSSAPPTW